MTAKGRITKIGQLEINGRLRACPFDGNAVPCGDWCALFGEPHPVETWTERLDDKGRSRGSYKDQIGLELCYASWRFDELIDERSQ